LAGSIDGRQRRPVLEVNDLCVSYGKVEALHHVGIRVGEGQIVTVIGPNGAGKTTMLSAIMGLLPRAQGLRFQGEDLGDAEVEDMVALGVNLVPESRACLAR
jgi:branched-chain amino acid transport system ATP-binding protein